MRAWARLGRALVDVLFPESGCAVCGGPLPELLSPGSGAEPGGPDGPPVPWEPEACPVCLDDIFSRAAGRAGCGFAAWSTAAPSEAGLGLAALSSPSAVYLDGAVTAGVYAGALEKAVLRLKSAPDRRLARFLGRLLAEALDEARAAGPAAVRPWTTEPRVAAPGAAGARTAVVPVPLHPDRMRERGFNQAALLAEALGSRLGAPVRTDLCRRVRPTPLQSSLSRAERLANVVGAFGPGPGAHGPELPGTVLLVDDVLTTGATVGEVARVLRAQGVARVWAVVVCRAGC